MEQWLLWARGPLFLTSMTILVAGLLRIVALNAVSILALLRSSRRSAHAVPWSQLGRATLRYLFPIRSSVQARSAFSLTSIVFHVSIIVTPLFLGAHVMLWQRGVGLTLPTLPASAADVTTVVAVVSSLVLLLLRVASPQARAISRPQDYLLPLLIATPFLSGFLAMHPSLNPFSYEAAMLVHVLSGDLILILIPFSKLSHFALFPVSQLVSELGWHLKPGAGDLVALSLGKESKSI